MELLCPHCLKRVTVADDKAGQVLNCPLCSGVFAAPSLPSPSSRTVASGPPVVVPPTLPNVEMPVPSISQASQPIAPPPLAPPPAPPPPRPEPPRPVPPPGEYTHEFSFRLRPEVLVWVPPVCLFLILFFFSIFFSWHWQLLEDPVRWVNLWGLGFTSDGSLLFLAYLLLIILTWLVSVACLLLEERWLLPPPPLVPLMPWKSGVTFVLLAFTFLLLCYDYQQGVFVPMNPIGLGEKIALRVHLVAVVASGLELWAQGQTARNLPLPLFRLHW
jgi:hypothetical protein